MTASCLATLSGCLPENDSVEKDTGLCIPATCLDRGWECGTIRDGCDGLVSCGRCESGFSCDMGVCEEVCIPDCMEQCGGESNCPDVDCTDDCALTGRTCDLKQDPPVCTGECVPRTCHSIGVECDSFDDWCGGTVDCGFCLPESECIGGICTAVLAEELGAICDSDPEICREPFPDCIKLTGMPAFCTRTCTGDGQCGSDNCCAPIIDDTPYCVPGASTYLCDSPVGSTACFFYETCLPSPNGNCLLCFGEGEWEKDKQCDTFNSCIAGLYCLTLDVAEGPRCQEICDPTNVEACSGEETARHCEAMPELGDYGICVEGTSDCKPSLTGADCPADKNCVPDNAACASFSCQPFGNVPAGESCAKHENCEKGAYCQDGTCRQVCSASLPCPDYYECVQGCSTKIHYCAASGGQECTPGSTVDTCLEGQSCIPANPTGCTIGFCYNHGNVVAGGQCVTHADCVLGTACFDATCMTICTFSKPCESPSFCNYLCTSVDFGVCIS